MEFEFPDMFKRKKTEFEKSLEDQKKFAAENTKATQKQWSQKDIPNWFLTV